MRKQTPLVVILIIWMGVFPKFFLAKMDLSVEHFLHDVKSRYEAVTSAATATDQKRVKKMFMANSREAVKNTMATKKEY